MICELDESCLELTFKMRYIQRLPLIDGVFNSEKSHTLMKNLFYCQP